MRTRTRLRKAACILSQVPSMRQVLKFLEDSSTYNPGSFKIKNTSPNGHKIQTLRIHLGSSVLPDMLFDPKGTAGDTTAKCFQPDSGGAVVGLVAPADPCATPFSEPRDGGYEILELAFNDFNAGEEFTFSVDVDPTSIKGFAGAGGAGSVSGLELTGALATAGFDDGSSRSEQTFRIPASATGSQNTLKANPPAKPTIEVVGVSAPAKVQQAQQTVRVTGTPNSSVSLMVLEGGMFTQPSGGFYDLDPYEANSAVKVSEQNATIGSGGTVDIPVRLTRSSDSAGLNYMVTVMKDASGRSGPNSNVLVLEYVAGTTNCTKTGTTNAETISGTSGADVICGGGGNDTINGLGGNDIVKGEGGADKLIGGVGNDTLDGGLATDTASYSPSLSAVTASLAINSSTGEGADTFAGVENLLGSSKADTLTGSGANNTLTGGGGNDTERGGAGSDKVVGSGGADLLYGEGGADTVNSKDGVNANDSLNGGGGTDTKVTDTTEKSIVNFP
jgi:Ca2+-binding RTX toxin-like protein